jgi:hypothetical protein
MPTNEEWAKDYDEMAKADRGHARNPVQAPTPAKKEAFLRSALASEREAAKLRRKG